MGTTVTHLVLLGDSTIDNKFYVGKGNLPIIDQLKIKAQERGWNATSVAVDGHSISHISSQLTRIPQDATHLFISIGGNDALCYMQRLKESVANVGEGLLLLSDFKREFEKDYSAMLKIVSARKIPATVCTMYNPNFENPEQQRMCETGLCALNDVIITESTKIGIPVIDLKTIFNDPNDYANHIEPDVQGGSKIVENILHVMDHHRFNIPICSIYAK
ncbi:unnamed protein product [Rotaria magnacalcarata]|uniref:SGNH hydrolase-type esterase domain-containing protein n=1 Tax=Rotaria magnacalcarata TaxID=392030 RepID=A0A818ZGQ3_9BILA|nr:unnamed protein product [Rotaria magnacalcarata]CAF2250216.1 unnamed protein product [Rotaria magnacalcarata]CAF3768830.1 unnamed protein product [Rotaria magnacalcarata]CAF4187083.1 unnamed protein product [Rotaria magnacalcarata]